MVTPPRKQIAKNKALILVKRLCGHTISKAFAITGIAFALSFVLTTPFTASVTSMFSSPEKSDFQMSDLFASVADGRPVRYLDDRIVIADIGICGRAEMAEALEILALCDPAAVGLDVNFALPKDSLTDSRLIEAVSNLPMLVLPYGLSSTEDEGGRHTIEEKPFFHASLPDLTYAASNLAASQRRATVRKFPVSFNIEGSKEPLPSFATALASLGAPVTAERLLARGHSLETIDYPSRQFRVIPLEDMADEAESLTGKFVLIGAMQDASDMHATPIDSYMSGLMIHAHSLATILDGAWYTDISHYADYALAVLTCLVLVYICISVGSKLKSMMLRVIQVAALYAAVRIGYALYVDNHVIFNFSYTFLMITFGLFAVDIWNGLCGLWEMAEEKYRKFIRKPKTSSAIPAADGTTNHHI